MQEPELYSEACDLQKTDAKFVLENYFRLIRWKRDEVVMDIGCGTGDVTLEILLPLLPNNFNKLIGIDIADVMVETARKKTEDEKVHFRTFDVTAKSLVVEFEKAINHVFSFYCLHWVQDQRTALQNIYSILKPAGDILLVYLAENPIYDIYEHLAEYTRWAPHMVNWKEYCSPFHHCDHPEKKLEDILLEVGFITHVCKTEQRCFTYHGINVLRKSALAVIPFTENMSEEQKDDFMDDYINELRKTKNITIESCENNNEEEVTMVYKIIVVFASKLL